MAEWLKAAVLKTVVRKYRGFESYFLRQFYRKLSFQQSINPYKLPRQKDELK